MDAKTFLKTLDFSPPVEVVDSLKKECWEMVKVLETQLKKQKLHASIFIGGSFIKNTLMRAEQYDVDLFIRFDKKYDNLSNLIKKLIQPLRKNYGVEEVHGSRDYLRLVRGGHVFEIIPVLKITKPKEAVNVTDLS